MACSGLFLKLSSAKFAPCCGEKAVWKARSFKRGGLGAFVEVQTHVAGGRDFDTLQDACKTLEGVLDLKRACNDEFRSGISCSVRLLFQASGVQFVEGLRILYS